MFESGYFTITRFGRSRTPVRVHWSAPVGAWLFTGAGLHPARWVTFLAIILCHELGHAVMVRIARAHVLSVELNALGGRCAWAGQATRWQRSYIAFGGVLAQGLLFLAAHLTVLYRLAPSGAHTEAVVDVLTGANLIIAALNLLPVAPFDGAEAWSIVALLPKRLRYEWLRLRLRALERKRSKRATKDGHDAPRGNDERWLN